MLMHHADAVRDRLARRTDADDFAVDANIAGVCFVKAIENRHQRRFASAVLADDAVNESALDAQIDVFIGPNRAETLVDPDEFDGGRRLSLGRQSHLQRRLGSQVTPLTLGKT